MEDERKWVNEKLNEMEGEAKFGYGEGCYNVI